MEVFILELVLSSKRITLEDLINVTRRGYKVSISEEAYEKIDKARALVDKYVEDGRVSYGITTGFGKFAEVSISKEQTGQLQKNIVMSHSCSVGNPLPIDVARGVVLLRAVNLAKGYSGARRIVVEKLVELLNKEVTPWIPEKGSVGSSGDLSPLAHMSLVLIGLGKAYYKGELLEAKDALAKAGIEPIQSLSSKEGLALTNGTQALTSTGAHVLYDAINLSKHLDIAASLTMESLHGIIDAYDPRISEVREHTGQINTAENMRKILSGSKNVTKQGAERVQDSYVLRCIPQIHGASKDTLEYVKKKVEIEINAVTDNPIIFVDTDEVISGGNFHGQPMALPFDFLGIALSEMANVSERRIEKMVNPAINHGLPAFLVEDGGLNSGFMIVQYSAAALVSENKVLAHPASVDSIPTSANQEDHVSMGSVAAKKSKDIFENVRKVIGMELITACQAIELKGAKDKLSPATKVAYEEIRKIIPHVDVDRPMYIDIHAAEDIIKTNKIVESVEKVTGELKY
ncbi:histidine ammonia-lyase [Fusobacterium simiae]|uniref:histidine ammonia-lyase n=1 Tax=Fusobacterium TaxID=848 RepID=UPI0004A29DAD|nr:MULTISPECIES: histidine ammonia-lyase [Fusobacterium]MDC7955899.1 histidine ammonia-lyase [Fusobacterium simiae]